MNIFLSGNFLSIKILKHYQKNTRALVTKRRRLWCGGNLWRKLAQCRYSSSNRTALRKSIRVSDIFS